MARLAHPTFTNGAAGILAAVAELRGVRLIVSSIRSAKKKLDTPEVFLLEAMERQGVAVALLVIGGVRNFLMLG